MATPDLHILYWYWLLLGIALVIAEIFLASFTLFWFGLAAILVGVLLWLFPSMPVTLQLFIWVVASCGLAIYWFRYFKPKMVDKTLAGISREAVVGEKGQVIRAPVEDHRGLVRFPAPILGDDEWHFICSEPVKVGDRVRIQDFSGNTLIVEKTD